MKKFSDRDPVEVENSRKRAYRISEIRQKFVNGNNQEFATILGISKQYSSGLCTAGERITERTLEKILQTFPNVSRMWLYFGEGSMLRQDNSHQSGSVGDNSGIIVQHGDNSTYHNNTELLSVVQAQQDTIKRQQDTIATLTETNRQQTEQMGRLIAIIESKM